MARWWRVIMRNPFPAYGGRMRAILVATSLLALSAGTASAQSIHPGEVERWYLALAPLHDARACITDQDPLRRGLDALLHDTLGRATHAIRSDYEKGMLAGRLHAHAVGDAVVDPDDATCHGILSRVARGLLRLHIP
jgi:hypothetical protein